MAKVLETFDFDAKRNRPSPYDKFLDGQIWQLTVEDGNKAKKESNRSRTIDFKTLGQFRSALNQRARMLDKSLRSVAMEDTLVVQATPAKKEVSFN